MTPTDESSGDQYDLYFAGPLFNDAYNTANERLVTLIEERGYDVFLPIRDGIEVAAESGTTPPRELAERTYELDATTIRQSRAVVAVLDGPQVDPGVAVEIGIALENDIPVLGLRTDTRTFNDTMVVNPMVAGGIEAGRGWFRVTEDATATDLAGTVEAFFERVVSDE